MAIRSDAARFGVAALALGAIGYWASEAAFWSFPPEGVTAGQWAMTVVVYTLAGAAALLAVGWAGTGGLTGAFLGGAILGFVVEGVIVSTMYDAFPVQLVWTPIAWHALITGCAVFALHRRAVHWTPAGQAAAMLAVGLFGGYFAGYWPHERAVLPGAGATWTYHLGTGAAAVAGFVALDRVGPVPRPPIWLGAAVVLVLLGIWVLNGITDPRPERLALPVMIGVTLWAMRRLGTGEEVSLGPAAPVGRHLMFLIAPALVAAVAAYLVRGSAGTDANIVVALATGGTGLALWLWCLWRAAWRVARSGAGSAGPEVGP